MSAIEFWRPQNQIPALRKLASLAMLVTATGFILAILLQ